MTTASTFKIFFESTVNEEDAKKIIARHAPQFILHNYYQNLEVGKNKVTFGVVDIADDAIETLKKESQIKDIDRIASTKMSFDMRSCCDSGGCGCG